MHAQERAETGETEGQRKTWDPKPYETKPVQFAIDILRFKPTEYQTTLLTDGHKRSLSTGQLQAEFKGSVHSAPRAKWFRCF